jgi:RNA polymerase sigma factor (sigma-70 family)
MQQQGGLSDADLVRWALSAATTEERKAAYEVIADRYHRVVYRECVRRFPDPEQSQEVCQAAFEAAFTLLGRGKAPEQPDKLAGWLIEIARYRSREYWRKDKPSAVSWAMLPQGEWLEHAEDEDEYRSGSAGRLAHVQRLVEAVVATLTARQQQVYRLRIEEELTGRQVAERLGIAVKTASNEITRVQDLVTAGFGALILFQEGRRYCPDLARIIERDLVITGTGAFTSVLRERIVRHFGDCNICDNCFTCNNKRGELVGPYAPALIPVLFAAELRDRILESIDRLTQGGAHPQPDDSADTSTFGPRDGAVAPAGAALLDARPGRAGHSRLPRPRRALRRRSALSVLAAAIVLAAIGGAAVALASGGDARPGSSAAVPAVATSTGVASTPPTAGAPGPGVITTDFQGVRLSPQYLAIAGQVLVAARAHDSAAMGKLLAGNGSQTAAALDKVLAEPGAYEQIVTLLTKTHAVGSDGYEGWPSFELAETSYPRVRADLEVLGVASPGAYTGLTISIGDQYSAKPSVLKLEGIGQS